MLPSAVAHLPTPAARDWKSGQSNLLGTNSRPLNEVVVNVLPTPTAADGERTSTTMVRGNPTLHGAVLSEAPEAQGPGPAPCGCALWGQYAPAVHRWETALGQTAPSPTEPGRDGKPRLSPRAVEFMMGLQAGWVTDVPGLSRNDLLKLLGNGVVPQQGAAAIRPLLWLAFGTVDLAGAA